MTTAAHRSLAEHLQGIDQIECVTPTSMASLAAR